MDPRFTELFHTPPNIHQNGCPVYISTSILFRDNYSSQALAQIIMGNLSTRNVVACTVEVRSFAVNGQALDTVSYQYMDLRVPQGSLFGNTISIALPNPNTRRIQVYIREVVLDPFRVWNSEDDTLQPLPQPERLESLLPDPRHMQHYAGLVGKPCTFVPRQEQGLFLCTCGQTGVAEDGPCRRCGSTYELLHDALDVEAIHAAVNEQLRLEEEARIAAFEAAEAERLAREQEEAERLAAKKARNKRIRKRLLTAVAILVVIAALAGVTVGVILPAVERSNAYKAAAELCDTGSYVEAEAGFLALEDYKDAPERAMECRYLQAEEYLQNGDYQAAIDIWNGLAGYSDSADRAEDALLQWKDGDYQAAMALKDSGSYTAAANAFGLLGDFKDAQEQQALCLALQQELDYAAALDAAAAGDYLGAMAYFRQLGDYQDAVYQYACAAYLHASALFDNGEYKNAVTYFEEAGDFEDAAQRRIESIYQYGCALLAEEQYSAAIVEFGKCSDHSDAAKKLLDAKFGYVNAHLDATNTTTYTYLKELVDANYSGAKKVFSDLYAWKVTIIAFNNNPYDNTSSQDSLSKYQQMCVHYKVTGGEPGATQTIRTVITLPNGNTGTVYQNNAKAGESYCTYGWYDTPAYGATGTLYFWAYDEAGNLIGSGTVRVTN